MMALEGASVGFQLGGQATDFVLLLMSPTSAANILKSKVKIGGDASAAAGPVGRNASAETDVTMRAEILSYSRARGLFAGISLSGSTLRPDNDGNKKLYGKDVTADAIVFDKAVPPPPSAAKLLATLNKSRPRICPASRAGQGQIPGIAALTCGRGYACCERPSGRETPAFRP
jgi:lipid-binding SYLF domain-containing protein